MDAIVLSSPNLAHESRPRRHIAPFVEARSHALAIDSDNWKFSSADEYTGEYTEWLQHVRTTLVVGPDDGGCGAGAG